MNNPLLPANPAAPIATDFPDNGVSDELRPLFAAAARRLALRKGGEHRLSAVEEHLLKFLQSIGMLTADTLMLAEYQHRPVPTYFIGQRLTLTYLKNDDAATGVTVYD